MTFFSSQFKPGDIVRLIASTYTPIRVWSDYNLSKYVHEIPLNVNTTFLVIANVRPDLIDITYTSLYVLPSNGSGGTPGWVIDFCMRPV